VSGAGLDGERAAICRLALAGFAQQAKTIAEVVPDVGAVRIGLQHRSPRVGGLRQRTVRLQCRSEAAPEIDGRRIFREQTAVDRCRFGMAPRHRIGLSQRFAVAPLPWVDG